jgi:hypothetical protein
VHAAVIALALAMLAMPRLTGIARQRAMRAGG